MKQWLLIVCPSLGPRREAGVTVRMIGSTARTQDGRNSQTHVVCPTEPGARETYSEFQFSSNYSSWWVAGCGVGRSLCLIQRLWVLLCEIAPPSPSPFPVLLLFFGVMRFDAV